MTLRVRLSVMMFLQYFLWGAWWVTLGTYLGMTLRFTPAQVGLIYGSTAVAAILSPFFMGMIADRFYPAQRLLALLHLAGGAVLLATASATTFGWFYAGVMIYAVCYVPTIALSTAICFRHLENPAREFPIVRIPGTTGWLLAGVLVGQLHLEATAVPMKIAAAASILLGVFAFVLPHTPPPRAGLPLRVRDIMGLDALALMRRRAFAVFMAGTFLLSISIQFFYAFANLYLNEIGLPEPATKMASGQVTEIAALLITPWLLPRLGVKKLLLISIFFWTLRFLFFAMGDTGDRVWMIYIALAVHGICFTFFFVAGQLFVDREAGPALRASAQGLLSMVSMGLGYLVGSVVAGSVVTRFLSAGGTPDWSRVWLFPAAGSAIVFLLFAFFFRPRIATT